MSSTTTRVSLSPSPGFCVKSTSLNSISCPVSSSNDAPLSPATVNIPSGLKIFVNIAWDTNVPPPPDGSDAAIERAMSATSAVDPDQAFQWFVPVIVSQPRLDKDKAGKPSAVFDCVFNTSLKSRTLRSPAFKTYLIELVFQRIEAQYSLLLSRQIGTPNIASKGRLPKRSVLIPASFYTPEGPISSSNPASTRKPLVEELPVSSLTPFNTKTQASPQGILKKPPSSTGFPSPDAPSSAAPAPTVTFARVPDLTWSRTDDGRLRIALSVPHLSRESIANATLDIEPRRLLFAAPPPSSLPSSRGYALDLDLSKPNAELQQILSARSEALTLKRERELDVDGARAEWHIADGLLVIYA